MKLSKVLISEAAIFNEELRIGNTFESPNLRVHRFRDILRVTDVVNAGKRGKKCRQFSVEGREGSFSHDEAALQDAVKNLNEKTTYDELKKHIEALTTQYDSLKIYPETELRGVDVIPTSLKPFEFKNDEIYISSDIKNFTVRDLTDMNNEPTCISTDDRTGARGTKKFYDYLSKNPESVKNLDFDGVLKILKDLGIGYHEYCAVD